jgi:Na+-transporting methylmalonyl-CoA/oxaloacetate decarboxylase gamma subunit
MSILDSLLVSLFGISVVFFVLISLSFLLKLQSSIIGKIVERQGHVDISTEVSNENSNTIDVSAADSGLSTGELKLIDVDERTAAMIMAIVSDESNIPLSELQFKSIKLLDS